MAQPIPTRNGACVWSAPSTCDRAAGAAQGADIHCFNQQLCQNLHLETSHTSSLLHFSIGAVADAGHEGAFNPREGRHPSRNSNITSDGKFAASIPRSGHA